MKRMGGSVWGWLRGLVWTAMVAGCAWASAQSSLVTPSAGHYHMVAMGEGAFIEGAGQTSEPLPKDDLFAGTEVFAKGASDITEITMDPDSLNLVGGPDQHKARNMVLNVVRTYTYDKPGMYNMADVDAIRSKLNTGDWHCSVHIRDLKNGSGSDVCNKRRTDGMKETAIIEVEPKQLTFIHTIRRGGGPGESQLGFLPMLPGLHGLPALAMLDPEAFADMQIGLHGMPMMLRMRPDVAMKMNGLKAPPFDPEQRKRLDEQMKEFKKGFFKEGRTEKPPAPAAPQPE